MPPARPVHCRQHRSTSRITAAAGISTMSAPPKTTSGWTSKLAGADARVERIPQRVADEIDGQDRQHDHDPRCDRQDWLDTQILAAFVEHRAPFGGGWLSTHAQK